MGRVDGPGETARRCAGRCLPSAVCCRLSAYRLPSTACCRLSVQPGRPPRSVREWACCACRSPAGHPSRGRPASLWGPSGRWSGWSTRDHWRPAVCCLLSAAGCLHCLPSAASCLLPAASHCHRTAASHCPVPIHCLVSIQCPENWTACQWRGTKTGGGSVSRSSCAD